MPFARAYAVTCAGFFLNNVLPLRAGEAARLLWTCRETGASVPFGAAVLLGDRLLDMLALATVALAVMAGWEGFPGGGRAAAVAGSAALAAAVVLWALARRPETALALAARCRLPARAQGWLGEVALGAAPLAHPGRFLGLYLLSLAFWTMNVFLIALVSRAFGLDLTLLESGALITAFAFGAALPSAPGYIGTLEAAGVALLSAAGRPAPQALSFILTFHLAQILSSALLGLPAVASLGRGPAHAH